ncbi:MAG: NAD(P)-dependent oxidoreductase, partial [Candidatus Aenigmarchaeota archaeon]|nr:NAD(P)-dependent oxidoreductase [Candidatus Aenigmarchaeota archaeon]
MGTHLASELRKGHEVIGVARRSEKADYKVDVTAKGALEELLEKTGPEVVVNAVKPALSTDGMEEKRELVYEVNARLPERLARLQAERGYKLVHMSTDWVYEGKEGVTYSEESPTVSRNYYTYTKLVAEEKIRELASDYLMLRTEGVFGLDERGGNTFLRLKAAVEQGKPFAAATDQFSQPIYGGELARIIGQLVEKDAKGIFNAVGPDYVSRYGFVEKVCEKFGWKCELKRVSIKGRKIPVPSHLKVDISKIEGVVDKIKSLGVQMDMLK